MRSPPPEILKTWPKPNYVDPVTRGPGLMIVELTLLPLAMVVVFLRMYIRVAWLHKSWIDDYLMVLAMVRYCAFGVAKWLLTITVLFDRYDRACDHSYKNIRMVSLMRGPRQTNV